MCDSNAPERMQALRLEERNQMTANCWIPLFHRHDVHPNRFPNLRVLRQRVVNDFPQWHL